LLEPIERLREFINMVRILTIFKAGRLLNIDLFFDWSIEEGTCWGLVLKCYELRTRQHKMLNVNVLRPTKHYSLGDNGP
jgi:hypothetical protein